MNEQPSIAAIIHRGTDGVDDLVAGFALSLIGRGWQVKGLVQEMSHTDHGCSINLIDLSDGSCHAISQNLGPLSQACRLDTGRMAEAGAVLRRIATAGADLAVFNRFSKLEAEGQGFAAEMLDLAARGIPVLTVVPHKHLDAWRAFTGELGCELEARLDDLERWFLGINTTGRKPLAQRQSIFGEQA